eukprot:364003-Chlamydomonas_euryale.AAC.41
MPNMGMPSCPHRYYRSAPFVPSPPPRPHDSSGIASVRRSSHLKRRQSPAARPHGGVSVGACPVVGVVVVAREVMPKGHPVRPLRHGGCSRRSNARCQQLARCAMRCIMQLRLSSRAHGASVPLRRTRQMTS